MSRSLPGDSPLRRAVGRAATPLLIGHIVLIGFATLALVTIVLAPEPPSLMNSKYSPLVTGWSARLN